MPSTSQAGDRRERLHCEGIRKRISEDPARWLDWDLLSHEFRRKMVLTLIDGMDSVERVRAWRAAERRLAARYDREPRAKVMQRLDQREEWLDLHGERPDRLPHGPRRPCDCCGDEDGPTAAELRERDEEERANVSAGYTPDSVDTSETSPETEAATLGQYATDGGERQ
ncbi:hypothetical protein [Haloarcula amylovorans]|uniref:hypothetical protein n=1 Tax=Haloarcula amylovorans TaxID=2562280 RepID=UPI0010760AFF|nr:hypothetical protein [Halomicroarcula amylolytica]